MQAGAGLGRCGARQPLPVRAPGLLHSGPRFGAGPAGFQPHRRIARYVGQDREKAAMIIIGIGGILGDAATALLKDGELAAAVEESKLSRVARPGRPGETAGAFYRRLPGAGRDEPGKGGLRRYRAPPAGGAPIRTCGCVRPSPMHVLCWWSTNSRTPPPLTTPRLLMKPPYSHSTAPAISAAARGFAPPQRTDAGEGEPLSGFAGRLVRPR